MSNFISHKPSNPCPICGATKDCKKNTLTGSQHCVKANRNSPPSGWRYVKDDGIGFGVYFPDDDLANNQPSPEITRARRLKAENRKSRKDAAAGDARFNSFRSTFRPMDDRELRAMATHLYLPREVFAFLDVRILPDDDRGRMAWAFPEKDAAGKVIGYSLRYKDDSKGFAGHRGLSIPSAKSNDDPTSPIFLVEGASDTLAMIAMGLNVVGRPSNVGGVEHLITLLRTVNRPIIVVGENDERPDPNNPGPGGRMIWPGREGAETTAQKLADALGRPVYVAMPPIGLKDSRKVIEVNAAEIRAGGTSLAAVGKAYGGQLAAGAMAFKPTAHNEPPTVTTAAPVTTPATPLPPIGFNARECFPASDPSPRVEKPQCPTKKGVALRNRCRDLRRVQWFDCKRLSCCYCERKKREQYQATVQVHLEAFERDNPKRLVNFFFVDPLGWESVARTLRNPEKARYFTLATGGRLIVCSVTQPPASPFVSAYEKIEPREASYRLYSALERMLVIDSKTFGSSRAWKLVGNGKTKFWKEWQRTGKIGSSMETILRILEHHKIDFRVITDYGMFWGWQAWQWTEAEMCGKVKQIIDDISVGELLAPDSNREEGELIGAGIGDNGNFW